MKNKTMIYKPGRQYVTDGVSYDCTVVEGEDVEKYLKGGWFKHLSDFDKEAKKVTKKKVLKKVDS